MSERKQIKGYRQTVRQRTLTPSVQGSNPCSPAKLSTSEEVLFFTRRVNAWHIVSVDVSATVKLEKMDY